MAEHAIDCIARSESSSPTNECIVNRNVLCAPLARPFTCILSCAVWLDCGILFSSLFLCIIASLSNSLSFLFFYIFVESRRDCGILFASLFLCIMASAPNFVSVFCIFVHHGWIVERLYPPSFLSIMTRLWNFVFFFIFMHHGYAIGFCPVFSLYFCASRLDCGILFSYLFLFYHGRSVESCSVFFLFLCIIDCRMNCGILFLIFEFGLNN